LWTGLVFYFTDRRKGRTVKTLFCTSLGLVLPLFAGSIAAAQHHDPEPAKEAVCVLTATSGSEVSGVLMLTQEKDEVLIKGEIKGLKPGKHGFHIHSFGDLRPKEGKNDGAMAGGHYAPDGHEHGGPESKEHHAGDLGNITAGADGVAKVDVKAKGLKLHFIIGRSLVVHADEDDLKSQPAGNSGPRIGVGVIGVAFVAPPAK
jgi:Cu-Zn family superoxide dismutase